MFQKQKEIILLLEKAKFDSKDFGINYLLPHKDFFDCADDFTDFNCERLDGKENYLSLINQIVDADEIAKVFVSVYGFEEDENDTWIDADTLIIFSGLPFSYIQQIFNKSSEISPSDIDNIIDFDENYIIIDKDGNQSLAKALCNDNYYTYFCWWD